MKFENTEVYGFKRALKGMRNPLESWHKNDTVEENGKVVIGENDLDLAQRLIKSGSEHRKFMRQIFVSVDITGPLYWWKEFETMAESVIDTMILRINQRYISNLWNTITVLQASKSNQGR